MQTLMSILHGKRFMMKDNKEKLFELSQCQKRLMSMLDSGAKIVLNTSRHANKVMCIKLLGDFDERITKNK